VTYTVYFPPGWERFDAFSFVLDQFPDFNLFVLVYTHRFIAFVSIP